MLRIFEIVFPTPEVYKIYIYLCRNRILYIFYSGYKSSSSGVMCEVRVPCRYWSEIPQNFFRDITICIIIHSLASTHPLSTVKPPHPSTPTLKSTLQLPPNVKKTKNSVIIINLIIIFHSKLILKVLEGKK